MWIVSRACERCWGIHAAIVERVKARFAVEKHPSTAGSEHSTSVDGGMEGSFNAWSGPLPAAERLAQQGYDHTVRELGYRTDPMTVLAQRFFGPEEFKKRLELRIGLAQMTETRGKVASD